MEDEEQFSIQQQEEETQQVLKVLQALKQASQDLQTNPEPNSSESDSPIKALLELETESNSLLSSDPNLSNLSHHLSDLKTLISSLQKSKLKHGLRSFLTRRVKTHEITRVAESIESEIQSWIDRETISNLTSELEKISSLESNLSSYEEDELIQKLGQFHFRLSQGFDIKIQDLLLKSRIFEKLEFLLCNVNMSKRVRENAGFALKEVVLFNKDVFVGQVLIGQTIRALVSMETLGSLEVLGSLIKAIRSPLVDVIESVGGISKVILYLNSDELELKIMAFDCVLEIGYFGRKEAVEAMLNEGLIKKLVELQRSKLGGDLIDLGKVHGEIEEDQENKGVEVNKKKSYGEKRFLERHPFASCVARFAVQLEIGEGLRQREKRAFKQEILKKIREASNSDAEAATIVAEVLWGSSP